MELGGWGVELNTQVSFFFITQLQLKAFAPHLKHVTFYLTCSHLTTRLCVFPGVRLLWSKANYPLTSHTFLPRGKLDSLTDPLSFSGVQSTLSSSEA